MTAWISGTCETNGITVHYLRTGGAKPPVVLLHGLMGSGACWTPLARALEAEFDVVMPDARGHGDSSAPDHGYRYDDLAADVAGLVGGLQLSRPVLLGHSMGGMTAAVVAGRGDVMISGLILIDPTFLSPERQREVRDSDVADQHRRMLGLQKADLVAQARARHPQRSQEILELQAEARLETCMDAFDVLAPPSPAYRDVVRAIDVPSLLVIGDAPVVTLDMATELRRLNPRVRIEQVQDAGHGLPFDQPERLGELVIAFLRELVQDRKVIHFYSVTAEYGEFSNFAPYSITLKGKRWPTSEHYFQAQKFVSPKDQEEIRTTKSPMIAARMGRDRKRKLRRDWEAVKIGVMREAVEAKFRQHDELRVLLVGTGDARLVEHTENDDFWGDGGDGSGRNELGRVLMAVREVLRRRE